MTNVSTPLIDNSGEEGILARLLSSSYSRLNRSISARSLSIDSGIWARVAQPNKCFQKVVPFATFRRFSSRRIPLRDRKIPSRDRFRFTRAPERSSRGPLPDLTGISEKPVGGNLWIQIPSRLGRAKTSDQPARFKIAEQPAILRAHGALTRLGNIPKRVSDVSVYIPFSASSRLFRLMPMSNTRL